MAPNIHLHIGEPKSGTTYLQQLLQANKAHLEQQGLLVPEQSEQIKAAQDAIRGRADGVHWAGLAQRLLDWRGTDALISMETLCRAKSPAVRRALSQFPDATVRVHITVRDLARSLPAQWQQSTQHRKTWSWSEYCTAVVDDDQGHPARQNFWSQHDLPAFVDRWSALVGVDNVFVITVPQSGADPTELWNRFSSALGISSAGVQQVHPSNESLGATSAELLRRLNIELLPLDLSERQYNKTVRGILARTVLAARRGQEKRVVLPESAFPWAEQSARRLIKHVADSGVTVVGDLDELLPQPLTTQREIEEPTDSEMVEAAMDAVGGLVQALAEARASRGPASG